MTQSGETDSSLPFFNGENDFRMTLLRSLEVTGFNPKYFSSKEKDWMRDVGILAQNGKDFDNNYLVNIGQALYRSLFASGKVEDAFKAALQLAQNKNTQLHLQLRFEDDSSKRSRLADYPWELIHDGQDFLLHHQVTFSRYIAHNKFPPNLTPVEKLNVLLISSAAFDKELGLQKLSKKEQQAICKGLETANEAGDINLDELDYPTIDELRTYLIEHQGNNAPHVVHFDGHGIFAKRCKNQNCRAIVKQISTTHCSKCNSELPKAQGYLAFEGEGDKPDYVSARELGALLQISGFADGNQTSGLALVVLSACQSAMTLEGESVFNGSAQNLINHRIPAVVAMQYSVKVDAATEFAKQFYRSLGQKNSLAVAISQGREAMGVEGNQWYRPVLYLRWQDNQGGQLFALPSIDTSPKSIPQNLPRSGVIKFVGREEVLETLHQQLQENERVAISAITGMGGIGKTELALQYGDRHWKQGTYSGGICWFPVRDEDVGIKIIDFAREIGLQPPDNFYLLNKVKYCWRNWQAGDVLVVFDDVREYQQIKDYLPPNEPRFKILVTTRQQWLGQSFKRVILEVLEENAALELLVSFVGEERVDLEKEEAKKLCADLGYLPLGLELVARYLQRKPNLSLIKMCQRLALEHRSLIERSGDMTAKLGVKAAFELSWRELKEETQELACLLSIFALALIPWELVEQCLPEEDKEDLEDIRDDFLVDFSLLEDKGENSYQLHQLIREFLIGKREELADVEDMKRGFCYVIAPIGQKISNTPTQSDILELTLEIPHLIETVIHQKDYLADEDLIIPFTGLGKFYKGQAAYNKALFYYEKCLAISKERFGEEHYDVATSFNNLAEVYYSLGNFQEPESLYLKALEIWKKLLGEEHHDFATGLNNLAKLYNSQGRFEQAEPLYLKALGIWKKLVGEEHHDFATGLNNLAVLYYSKGRYQQAEPLYKQALQIRKKLLGEEHPNVVQSLNNLAVLYNSQGRYSEAEPLYKQALEMGIKLLGESHPDVALSLNNLAALYDSQERYSEAEPLYLQALQVRKKLLGEEHPDIAQNLNNLAVLYSSQGNYSEAESHCKQALQMRKKLLGESHPEVANSLNNLATLYRLQKRYSEAEILYLQTLQMRKKLLGESHPDFVTSLNNLAGLYNLQRRYQEAQTLYKQALNISEQLLGVGHPKTMMVRENYASCLKSMVVEKKYQA
ncbi:tetratricopeptide repeat protein [Rivularia sp. PCC 7116]|uniref:tetratricopeptide repeat protein n=1 Tax=Rivularia sp. PCC 7116 TaxID=373994 RepID=UPI0018DEE964|nr:tetratricopeptide repeat protein [Rivularia sp. PCC 7116]